jgi:hypothetical protein
VKILFCIRIGNGEIYPSREVAAKKVSAAINAMSAMRDIAMKRMDGERGELREETLEGRSFFAFAICKVLKKANPTLKKAMALMQRL